MKDIKTRAFAGAFIQWQDEVLLMKRSLNKTITPGLWAGVGGHIEQSESDSPATACLREITEETGILPIQIEQLDLRYFALCKMDDAIDSIYYFIATLKEKPPLCETDEGELYWVKIKDGITLEMSPQMKAFYLNWINNLDDDNIYCFIDPDFKSLT